MKKLLVYLRNYKKECVLAPLFKMLEASFELLVPLVMARIMDVGIAGNDMPYIWKMAGILLLLAVIGLTCSLTAQYFAAKAAVGFSTELKHALFGHIQKLSFSEIDTAGSSTLITRMTSDMNQVQNGVNMVLRLFLRSPFIVFGAMLMAFTINWKAAMVFVVAIPLLSIVVFGIMLISIPKFKKVQERLDDVLGSTRETLTGVRVIRAFNQENEEQERFYEKNEWLTRLQLMVGRISALMNPITFIIVNDRFFIYIGNRVTSAFFCTAVAATTDIRIDCRFSTGMLLHLSGAASASHTDIFQCTAKARCFMAFEVAQTDKNICVHDCMTNQCCFAIFSVDNRNFDFIGSSHSISDDNLASCGNGIESIQIRAVKMLQGIFSAARI